MNYIHDEKLVFWGLQRTGSRYIYECLKDAYSFDACLIHGARIDLEYADYDILCSVRNPYFRALSVWKWMNHVGGDRFCPRSFPDFVRRVFPGYAFPITIELGSSIDRVDHFIRIEYCEKDLKKIPSFPGDFEFPENTYRSSYRLSPKEYYADRRLADRIWDTYREDFETFGYARDSYMEISGDR
jgi:hypothetical protein